MWAGPSASATMAPEMTAKIREYNSQYHTKQVIITGHSQGGAIAFLTRSYLHYEQEAGRLPKELIFKSYNGAAPKPGNLYYGYDYDYITRNGWAFTVVNALDWVPETPFSCKHSATSITSIRLPMSRSN